MACIIIPYMEKGGVGKTTITACLGYALADYGKVLMVDGDSQGDLTNQVLDVADHSDCGKDYVYLLSKKKSFSEVVFEVRPQTNTWKGLYLLGTYNTHKQLKQYCEYQFYDDHLRIKFMVKEAVRNGFDYILFDLPAGYDFYTKNVLSLANQIIPIVQCEEFGIDKFAIFLKDLKVLKEDFMADFRTDIAIANMVDKNRALHRAFLGVFQDMPFKRFVCPVSSEIPNAAADHKVIQEYRPKNSCVSVFTDLALVLHEKGMDVHE